MKKSVAGKPVAVVTGAGRGIGLGVAKILAERGHLVSIWELDPQSGAEAAQSIRDAGMGADSHVVDVSDRTQIEAATAAVMRDHGHIDALVNNAIIVKKARIEDLSPDAWNATIAVGLTGVFHCSQVIGRVMLAQGRGAIVNIASIAGSMPNPLHGSYSPTKAAVIALTQQLALEWASRGVRCNAISPGMVATPQMVAVYGNPELREKRQRMVPLGRIADGADMGRAVAFLLSDEAAYVNGVNLTVDGGFTLTLLGHMPVADTATADGRAAR